MTPVRKLERREFLKLTGTAGAGLLIGFNLSGCNSQPEPLPMPTAGPPTLTAEPPTPTPMPRPPLEMDAFISISPDDVVTLVCHRSEMGQGVRTALPMIIAEELCADWSTVRVLQAPGDEAIYGSQVTGGSGSVIGNYEGLRRVGAVVRDMLIAAAAQRWAVNPSVCYAENGAVINRETGEQLRFGELAEAAAQVRPGNIYYVPLKDPSNFTIIGTDIRNVDEPLIVTGRATFGLDVRVPDMLYAAIARCPIVGGQLGGYDASAAEAVDGVVQVVTVDSGVAVLANDTWAAIKGRDALNVTWNEGEYADLNSAGLRQMMLDLLQEELDQLGEGEKNPEAVSSIEATYENPYLAHATMEPMNATAHVRADAVEVWTPTQSPGDVKTEATRQLSRPTTVHVPRIGCGLGRRLDNDYTYEAVQVSLAVGAPVQVVWTREDDIQHDLFRPGSIHSLRAELDAQGLPVSWRHIVVGGGGSADWSPLDQGINPRGDQGYRVGTTTIRTHQVIEDPPILTGAWRAVYNNNNAFATECFLDEIARAGGRDPYEFRREITSSRQKLAVLERVAEVSHWGSPLPDGWARGLACHNTWGMSDVAEVVEISVEDDGAVRVHRVYCVIDCGIAVNPRMIAAQMESGIAVGLTAVLKGEITFENGRVQQRNFRDYPVLRIDEMPQIEVHIIESSRNPQGVGEMGIPPIAPAVVNAIYAATGKRIRRLPIRAQDLRES